MGSLLALSPLSQHCNASPRPPVKPTRLSPTTIKNDERSSRVCYIYIHHEDLLQSLALVCLAPCGSSLWLKPPSHHRPHHVSPSHCGAEGEGREMVGTRRPSPWLLLLLLCAAGDMMAAAVSDGSFAFEDNFDIMWAEDHFKTSPDGQQWYLYLDKKTGCGFQTKQRYRFGWFCMKLKLVGGDSAGVVTAYYMCSDEGAGPERDEVDFEFLGNRTGQPYTIQTNVYKGGVGNREMRHTLWFDPTADYHSYCILWNNHQLVFFVDRVPIRVYKNTEGGKPNDFFPNEKPMYVFSSIWNADDWATRGGLEKTDWRNAPFVSSYKDFTVDGCRWEDPYPACVATTTDHWWDQYDAWSLSPVQQEDFAWVRRNLVIYDYCADTQRYPTPPTECSL